MGRLVFPMTKAVSVELNFDSAVPVKIPPLFLPNLKG